MQTITEVDSSEEVPTNAAGDAKTVAATECLVVCVDKECDVICETKTLLEPFDKLSDDNRTLV